MNRRLATAVVAVALLVVGAGLWLLVDREPSSTPPPAPVLISEVDPTAEGFTAELWFPGSDDRLAPELRLLEAGGEVHARVAAVVGAVLAGPTAPERLRPFAEVGLGSVFLGADGVAYIDLRPTQATDEPPASGSTAERLRVGAIVHSVLASVPEVDAVALLWNGTQRASFAGHVDTSRPLRFDAALVRVSAAPAPVVPSP